MRYRLARFWSQQLDAIHDALLPLAVAVVVTALVIWLLTRWRYRRKLALLEAEPASRGAAATWDGIAAAAPAMGVEADPDSRDESRARRKALRAMTNAVDGAELALRSGGPDQIEGALPNMWLALATVRSAFELPIPAQGDDARANLLTGKHWLEHVRPALRAGDDDDARRRSVEFLRANGLQQA